MSTHANRVKMTVTSVASSGTGDITLNAASTGFRSFATAYGANATVDILITEGTAWEIARNCTYTHSGTTLNRGTLENSSTGSAVAFTADAVVSVIATADAGRRWDSAGLQWVAASVTGSNVTGVVGQMSALDVSGLTAARNFVLPAVAAVDDRVGVYITAGCTTAGRELIIIGNTGDTINGGSAATEWSRLFITNECVILRCTVANTAWVVDYDGRIPIEVSMSKSTGTNVNHTEVKLILLDTVDYASFGGIANTGSSQLDIRRTSRYYGFPRVGADSVAIAGHQTRISGTAGSGGYAAFGFDIAASGSCPHPTFLFAASAGNYLELEVYHASGTARDYWYGPNNMSIRVVEKLT